MFSKYRDEFFKSLLVVEPSHHVISKRNSKCVIMMRVIEPFHTTPFCMRPFLKKCDKYN